MAEEIIFKVGVNTGNTINDLNKVEKELDSIGKESKNVNNVEKAFEELNKKVQSGTLTARELGKAVKEYQTIALQAGRESPIGQQAIQEAANLSDKLADLRNEINRASHDGANMQAALQLGGTVASGFAIAQGGMALMGVASEDLQKTLVKLQAVQALLAGIEQIRNNLEKESFMMQKAKIVQTKVLTFAQTVYTTAVGTTTVAVKALNIGMMALPIVAIIAGIVALVTAIKSFTDATEEAIKVNEDLTKSYEKQTDVLDEIIAKRTRDAQHEIELMKTKGATNEEIHKAELNLMRNQSNARDVLIKREEMFIRAKREQYQKMLAVGLDDNAKAIKEEIEQARGKYRELQTLQDTNAQAEQLKNAQFEAKSQEERQKNAEKNRDAWKKAQEKRQKDIADAQAKQLEMERLFQDLINANIEDANQRELSTLATKHQREREEIIKKYGEDTKLLAELKIRQMNELEAVENDHQKAIDEQKEAERLEQLDLQNRDEKAMLEARLLRVQEDFFLEQELKMQLAEMEREQLLQNDELTAGERELIEAEYQAKIRALKDETAEHERALFFENIQNQIEWTQRGANAIQELSDSIFAIKMRNVEKGSKEEEKLAKKQFQINKAMQLSGAIIDGAKAVTTLIASTPPTIGVLPNPAFIAGLAFTVGTSLANIAKITSTQFESKNAGGGGVTPPNISAPTTGSPVNTFNQGTTTQTGNLGNENNATMVYVLDSEITAQQNNTQRVEAVSTIQ